MEPERIAPLRNYNKDNNTRLCKHCRKWKDLSLFGSRVRMPSSTTSDIKKVPTLYYRELCKECSITYIHIDKYCGNEVRKSRYHINPVRQLFDKAKQRASQKNIPFNITKSDIVIPTYCPLLNIPIIIGNGKVCSGSPSLDRIIPSKGYVKGNIIVISHRANTAKNDLSIEELELLINNLKRVLYKGEELLEN